MNSVDNSNNERIVAYIQSLYAVRPGFVFLAVSSAYLIFNLQFGFALDDSLSYLNARGTPHLATLIKEHFFISELGKDGLYRPARMAITFLLVAGSEYVSFLPDLMASVWILIACPIIFKALCDSDAGRGVAMAAVLWVYGAVQVIASGMVVLVSQSVILAFLYGGLLCFIWFEKHGNPRYLAWSALWFFLGSFYGEAVVIGPLAIGLYGVSRLAEGKLDQGIKVCSFGGLVFLLAVSNAAILNLDSSLFGQAVFGAMQRGTTGIDPNMPLIERVLTAIWDYFHNFKKEELTGVAFLLSPYLLALSAAATIVVLIMRRRFLAIAAIITVFILLSIWLGALGFILGLLLELVAVHWRRHALFGSLIVAGLFVLGPVYALELHFLYILPVLAALSFLSLVEAFRATDNLGPVWRRTLLALCVPIPLIGISNVFAGFYFNVATARDHEVQAALYRKVFDTGFVLANFRHVLDFYAASYRQRVPGDHFLGAYFTIPVPHYGPSREVLTGKAFSSWIDEARKRDAPIYLMDIGHARLPARESEVHPFLRQNRCRQSLVAVHPFEASAPFADPFLLLNGYFQDMGFAVGFLGYPIFPDMIPDIGLEYGLFKRTIFAVYRIFRLDCGEISLAASSKEPANTSISLVRKDYHGWLIRHGNGGFEATSTTDPTILAATHFNTLATKIDARTQGLLAPDEVRVTASSVLGAFGPQGLLTASQPGWHSRANPKYPQSLIFAFSERQRLTALSLLPQDDHPQRQPKNFVVEVSPDGSKWNAVLTVKNGCDGPASGWSRHVFDHPADTMWLRLRILSNCGSDEIVTLRGVRLEVDRRTIAATVRPMEPGSAVHLTMLPASKATITASSILDDLAPTGLLDVTQPGWHSMKPPRYPELLNLVFSRPETVGALSLLPQDGFPDRGPRRFAIEASQDGVNWSTISQVADACQKEDVGWRRFVMKDSPPASYLRLRIFSNCGSPEVLTLRGLQIEVISTEGPVDVDEIRHEANNSTEFRRLAANDVVITSSSVLKNFQPTGLLGAAQPGWHSRLSPDYPQHLIFAFSKPEKVRALSLLAQDGYADRGPRRFVIELSDDNVHWRPIGKVIDACHKSSAKWRQFRVDKAAAARFMRLNILANCGSTEVLTLRGIHIDVAPQ